MKNIYIDVKDTEPGGGPVVTDEWVRPSDWLVLPTLVEGDQKVVGLHAVYGDSDFVSVLCAGAYTVNWGDGTIQNIAANTKCDHKFDYSALAGTECSRGYRQAIVTITPQAGQQLTKVDFQQRHSAVLGSYSGLWLDIRISGSYMNNLRVGGVIIKLLLLEQFWFVGNNSINLFSNLFYNCFSLKSIPTLYTLSGNSFDSMFSDCHLIKNIPLINTVNGTNFNAMFYNCYSLESLPLINTVNGTNFNAMFYNCYSLESLPLIETSKGSVFSYMFSNCFSLKNSPLINTSSGTNFSYMFSGCNMSCIPLINTANGTNFSGMFSNNPALIYIPLINTAKGINFNSILSACPSVAKATFQGTADSISYQSCNFSSSQLEAIFNAIATVSGKTINVANNWGTQYLTDTQKAIATNKGWTLVL